ncbi:Aromatic amino acid beta-eliminating lyase/threonine aldolase [Cinnamomum micranthum f. kanehirae]|uniref:Aromatic amino acid beta-eliminating lyase/threonine aldolase n=1 Tax=Cinnamomum micranthum f. kanehirae TaxID=337451 RepID=A0A3S3MHP7_9MAGN|nr:Aromatic amino acid beta-eliminating lyase/threonine aldolase [Cinnamomum micranthum f. kanehirae]
MTIRKIDLRSDTVTKPTLEMWAAKATAEVNDDIVAFDPTTFQFETEMVRMMGKESALFSHIHVYENGGISTFGGVHSRTVKNNVDGTIEPADYLYYPTTRLICLENTHASCGGRCISLEYTDRVGEVAKKHGLKLHIDGARIFNASVALGVPVHRLVKAADSVSVCLSKGLGAPVGSVIVGSKGFITKAKRLRKALGGSMRQVGVLCAAAFVALQDNVGRLADDHKKTKIFADGLNQIKGLEVDMASVETNIIFFDITEGVNFVAEDLTRVLEKLGVLVWQIHNGSIRAVLHYQISESDVRYALTCIQQAVVQLQGGNDRK